MTSPGPAFCSFSSGKDSVLALHRALEAGYEVRMLLTAVNEDEPTSRTHRIPVALLREQSGALGIEQEILAASWGNYESRFMEALRQPPFETLRYGVFGDIDLMAHREWAERTLDRVGKEAVFPLWEEPRRTLVRELLRLGYAATIVAVQEDVMDPRYLGLPLTAELLEELEEAGLDACGENGEFHTFVTDGPLFHRRVELPPHRPARVAGLPFPGGGRLPAHWTLEFDLSGLGGAVPAEAGMAVPDGAAVASPAPRETA